MRNVKVTIVKMSASGHGVSEKGIHVLGAFPGDVVEATIYKEAEGIVYAELTKIVEPSNHRVHTPTSSPFFDANAPWEHLESEQENKEKLGILKEIYTQYADVETKSDITKPGSLLSNYRNKAAYAFTLDKKDRLAFALFTRGIAQSGKIPQSENILVHPTINTIGKQFLNFFNQKSVSIRIMKYLTLRYSYHTDTVVAHILVTESNRKKLPWKKADLEKLINQNSRLQGVIVSQSEQGVRSANIIKDFYYLGDVDITEQLLGKNYTYHPSQFFQIYPEAFEQILDDASNIISNIPDHSNYELLDFFAGIGIIGIHLADLVRSVHGVEQSPLAKTYAKKNARANGIENFSFSEADVDQALDHVATDQILVVDPARSGLTKKSLDTIIEVGPKYIVYISCNPETQAQDYNKLKELYEIQWSRAYNLFPKTPHIEHMMLLTKKAL